MSVSPCRLSRAALHSDLRFQWFRIMPICRPTPSLSPGPTFSHQPPNMAHVRVAAHNNNQAFPPRGASITFDNLVSQTTVSSLLADAARDSLGAHAMPTCVTPAHTHPLLLAHARTRTIIRSHALPPSPLLFCPDIPCLTQARATGMLGVVTGVDRARPSGHFADGVGENARVLTPRTGAPIEHLVICGIATSAIRCGSTLDTTLGTAHHQPSRSPRLCQARRRRAGRGQSHGHGRHESRGRRGLCSRNCRRPHPRSGPCHCICRGERRLDRDVTRCQRGVVSGSGGTVCSPGTYIGTIGLCPAARACAGAHARTVPANCRTLRPHRRPPGADTRVLSGHRCHACDIADVCVL